MMNLKLVGVIVLLIHDISDVFLIAGRTYTDLKNKNLVVNILFYIVGYSVWVYTRNLIFPLCIIKASVDIYM